MKSKGGFIVFEGADGSGTTTQSKRLAQRLRDKYGEGNVEWTCEPSPEPIGRHIKTILKGEWWRTPTNEAMKLLFTADRADHIETTIAPALKAGKWVVCDRYYLSTLVYQGASDFLQRMTNCTPGMKLRHLKNMYRDMEARLSGVGLVFPDVTMILDVSPEIVAQRRSGRGGDVEIFESDDMQKEVCALYYDWGKSNPRPGNCVMVDGWMGIDLVETRCWEIFGETFK